MNLKMIRMGYNFLVALSLLFIIGGILVVSAKEDIAVVYGNILIAMGITLLTNILTIRFSKYINKYCGYIFTVSFVGTIIVPAIWGYYTIFVTHSNLADGIGITFFSLFMAGLMACESEDLQKELKTLENNKS